MPPTAAAIAPTVIQPSTRSGPLTAKLRMVPCSSVRAHDWPRHRWQRGLGQDERPTQGEAELSSSLRVRCDIAGIVVGSPSDKAGIARDPLARRAPWANILDQTVLGFRSDASLVRPGHVWTYLFQIAPTTNATPAAMANA
jgi:hypothetical protein